MTTIRGSRRRARQPERADLKVPERPAAEADDLVTLVDAAYFAARDGLLAVEAFSNHRAIATASGHLAVMRLVIWPAARRALGRGDRTLSACAASARQALWALCLYQRWLAGEAHAARLPGQDLLATLRQRLDGYRSDEAELLARLLHQAAGDELTRLARSYRVALAASPSRPHPCSPHSGLLGWLAFRLHGGWDKVLDTLDSRPGRSELPRLGGHSRAPGRCGRQVQCGRKQMPEVDTPPQYWVPSKLSLAIHRPALVISMLSAPSPRPRL